MRCKSTSLPTFHGHQPWLRKPWLMSVKSWPKGEHPVSGARVHLCQLFTDISLGYGSLARVKNIHDHLSSAEKTVCHVFPGANGNAAVNHGDFSCRSESSNNS